MPAPTPWQLSCSPRARDTANISPRPGRHDAPRGIPSRLVKRVPRRDYNRIGDHWTVRRSGTRTSWVEPGSPPRLDRIRPHPRAPAHPPSIARRPPGRGRTLVEGGVVHYDSPRQRPHRRPGRSICVTLNGRARPGAPPATVGRRGPEPRAAASHPRGTDALAGAPRPAGGAAVRTALRAAAVRLRRRKPPPGHRRLPGGPGHDECARVRTPARTDAPGVSPGALGLTLPPLPPELTGRYNAARFGNPRLRRPNRGSLLVPCTTPSKNRRSPD